MTLNSGAYLVSLDLALKHVELTAFISGHARLKDHVSGMPGQLNATVNEGGVFHSQTSQV